MARPVAGWLGQRDQGGAGIGLRPSRRTSKATGWVGLRKSLSKTSRRALLEVGLLVALLLFSASAWPLGEKPHPSPLRARPRDGLRSSLLDQRITALESSRSDEGRLYGLTSRGLLVSDDGGHSWDPLPVGPTQEELFSLAVHPKDPEIVLLGRRDGLWRTPNGGRSWAPLSAPTSPPTVPLAIAISEIAPDIIYIATSREGVFKSADGGGRWTPASAGLPEARAGRRPEEFRSLVIHPTHPDTAYVAHERHGIYRTTDGGVSWRPFNLGLPFPLSRAIYPPRLAFDPDDSARLFLVFGQAIHSQLTKNRLYATSDDSEWLPVEVDLPPNTPVIALTVDRGARALTFWAEEDVWEVPLAGKPGQHP